MIRPPPAFLSLPSAGDRTYARLLRKLRLLALRRLLSSTSGDWGHDAAISGVVPRLRTGLTSAVRAASETVLDLIGSPDVLTPLLMLEGGIGAPDAALRAAIPPLLAGLAARRKAGTLPEALLWEAPVARLVDARGGRVVWFDPPAKNLLADASGLAVTLASGTRFDVPDVPPDDPSSLPAGVRMARPFHPVRPEAGPLYLSEVDTNPLSMFEAHPDKSGNAISFGDRTPGQWVEALGRALDLIRVGIPDWYAELRTNQERLVPVGYEPERHLSASYREAPRLAYLTLHPSPLTMAEALVHETQHTKLNTLSWFDPLLHNAHTAWTRSPVRPDLRPVQGVLLAAHAFVPVAAMHWGLSASHHPIAMSPEFARRRAEVLAGNENAIAAVEATGDPTPIGARVIREMRALHDWLVAQAPALSAPVDTDAMLPG